MDEPPSPLFSFGVIADIQYADKDDGHNYVQTRMRYYRNSLCLLRHATQEWASETIQPTFILQLGDIIDGFNVPLKASETSLSKVLSEFEKLKIPVHHIWGNHEFYNFSRKWLMESKLNSIGVSETLMTPPRTDDPESFYAYHFSPFPRFRMLLIDNYDFSVIGREASSQQHGKALKRLKHKNKNEDLNSPKGLNERQFVLFNGGIGSAQMKWINEVLETSDKNEEKVIVAGKRKALKLNFANPAFKTTAKFTLNPTIQPAHLIRSTVDEKEQKQLLMDLDVVMRSSDCPYIVQFYGALFREGDCWICMELMATSFDKFYKYVYSVLDDVIPEEILGKITLATVKALNHLKENLKIIHRDIKPSNILLDRNGNIKLCDFGISGQLVDSIAKTRDAGCRPYMAPERIDPSASRQGYDVRSDVWSLGITLYELATGRFPYPKWNSVFDQLTQVVKGDPPQLSNSEEREFSPSFINFVNLCLTKDESKRPKYRELLKHSFIVMYEERQVDVAGYVIKILDQMPTTPSSPMYVD
ncbi:dual specificity mitogen-activated protein kinase kinase 4 [Gastrophryne carolinensis]